jgi:hypothetical protein
MFDIAIVDTVMTVLAGYSIGKYFKKNVYWTIFWLVVVGEVMHVIFCVDTTVVKWLKSIPALGLRKIEK